MAATFRGPRLFWSVVLFAAAVLAASALSVSRTYGRPRAKMFVDPFGDFSAVFLPWWPVSRWGIEPGTGLDAVCWAPPGASEAAAPAPGDAPRDECVSLRGEGRSKALRFEEAIQKAQAQGAAKAVVKFETGVERELGLDQEPFGAAELWWFWWLYALAGLGMLWSGLTAYRMAGRRPGARAHLGLSASAFVFLVTFLDYHTTRWLAPLFAASTVGNLVGLSAVALCFPSPPRLSRRARLALAWLGGAAALFALALALAAARGEGGGSLRALVNLLNPWPLVVLALSVVLRLRRAEGKARRELVSAVWGLVPGPLILFGAYVATHDGSAFHLLLPFAVAAFPLAVGYALVRRNILDTDKPLDRRLFVAPVALGGLIAAGCAWASLRAWFLLDGVAPLKASIAAGLVSACVGPALAASLWRAVEHAAFSSGKRFRPTVERLADQLTNSNDEGAIRVNLCILVQHWLETDGVAFHAPPEGTPDDPLWRDLAAGHSVTKGQGPGERLLFVPLRSNGHLMGALGIAPKGEGAPFSAEDLALLDTITSLGALGINNARALRQIEELRRLEAEVNEGAQRIAFDLLSAELAHEIAPTLNYFRNLLDEMAEGRSYNALDVEIGRKEVERLKRMVVGLRKRRRPPLECRPLSLAPVVERALVLLRGGLDKRSIEVFVDVPAAARTVADPDGALQVLLNLVKNAAEHAPEGGRVEVVARLDQGLVLEVRDNGPGVPEDMREEIFHPWVSHRPGGTGLGLFVAKRLATSFDWRLSCLREEPWTIFRIEAPLTTEPLDGEGHEER